MRKTLIIALSIIGLLGFAGVSFALPYFSQTQSLVPGQDNTYNIGTTSPSLRYKTIYTTNLDISGTCTGCSSATFDPFSPRATTFGTSMSATTSPIWLKNGLYASTTAQFSFASTTAFTNSGPTWLTGITGPSGLAIDVNSKLYASATTTFSTGLTYSAGGVTCDTASASIFGCLSAPNFTIFNNKQAPGFQISTTTVPSFAVGNLAYLTGATPTSIGGVATSSLTASGVLSLSNPISVIGASASALTLTGGSAGQQLAWLSGIPTWTATSTFSVASSNGFAGSFTNANNPVLTISTSINGLLKGNGTALSLAALTDFPTQAANTFLVNRTGAVAAPTALATSSMFCASCATTIAYASSTAQSAPNIMATTNLSVGTTTPSTLFSIGNALTNGGLYFTTTGLGIGTSSPQFPFSVTPVLSNLASTFYINSSGTVVAYDSTNGWKGRLSPTRSFVLGTATTTTWTASTTASAYSPFLQMPFTGTLQQVRCGTDASFLGVNVVVNGSNATPSYFVASTTIGKVPFTAGNTFTAGQKILVNFGTTTTATATQINCTFDVTED